MYVNHYTSIWWVPPPGHKPPYTPTKPSPLSSNMTRRGTHILMYTGMCCSNGPFFTRIPKHGSHFLQINIPQDMGPFSWMSHVNKQSHTNKRNCKNRATISSKIPKNKYLFLPKWPLKMGKGFEAPTARRRQTHVQIESEYPRNVTGLITHILFWETIKSHHLRTPWHI